MDRISQLAIRLRSGVSVFQKQPEVHTKEPLISD